MKLLLKFDLTQLGVLCMHCIDKLVSITPQIKIM